MAMSGTRRLFGRFHLAFTVVLGIAVWLGIVVLAARPGLRGLFDWSPQKTFTASAATLELIDQVRERGEKLEIDMFWVPPQLQPGATDAERHYAGIASRVHALSSDLFEMLDLRGGDEVVFQEFNLLDPSVIAASRARVEKLGIQPTNDLVVMRLGGVTRKLSLYQDMAQIEVPRAAPIPGSRQNQQVLPVLKSFDGEEAVSSTLLSMLEHGNPKAYFVVGLGVTAASLTTAQAPGYTELIGALEDDGFITDFLQIDTKQEIPDDADVVVLLEPTRELQPAAQDVLWRYLRRGGRLVINFVYLLDPPDWNPRFPALLEKLGLSVGMAAVCTGIRSRDGKSMSGGEQALTLPAVPDPRHPITQPLVRSNRTPWLKQARALAALPSPEEGVSTKTTLLQTQPWSWLADRVGGVPDLRPRPPSELGTYSIGAVVEVEARAAAGETLPKDARDGVAVVYSGYSFINAGFKQNGDLALNTLNWLTDRRERVTVRADRYVSTKLTVNVFQLQNMRQLLVFWIPGALLALGISVFVWRNRY